MDLWLHLFCDYTTPTQSTRGVDSGHRLAGIGFMVLFLLMHIHSIGQSYTKVPSQYKVEPFPLHLPDDQVGMNSAVQTPDGFLWIASTRGLIIADGHKSILYTPNDPLFHLDLDDPNTFIGRLRIDSLGRVYAAVSSSISFVRFNPDTRTIDASWSFKDQAMFKSSHFDVSPQGNLFAILIGENNDTFSIWKLDTTGRHQRICTASTLAYGTLLNYNFLHGMHFLETSKGVLRISGDGGQQVFYNKHNNNQSIHFMSYAGDHYYFYDESHQALMFWDAMMDAPRLYTRLPQEVNIKSGQFMIKKEKIFIANGYYFMVLDTLDHTLQDLSKETYEMKKANYPSSISEDIIGFNWIDQQLFLLGSKFLYVLTAKPPPESKYKIQVPFTRPDISMRGLAEDEDHQVYASFYNGIMIRPDGQQAFKEWPFVARLHTDQYSAYSLTYRAPWLFWHSLAIHTRTGEMVQTIPNKINGHVVQLLSGDTLWLYSWYGQYLYAYDIHRQTLDSVRLESVEADKGLFPFVINRMIASEDPEAIWMATGNNGIRLIAKDGTTLQSFSAEELGTLWQNGINDLLLDGRYLWYASYEGLGRLNTRTKEYIVFKDPMITTSLHQRPRTIFTIQPDTQRGFYLGTQQGIVYFDTTTFQYAHLSAEHPLAQPEFNRTSAFRDSQGRFYFGSTNGLYTFLPEEIEFRSALSVSHPIKLYGVAIFNGEQKEYRYVAPGKDALRELVLQPSETNIAFNLSAPGFDHDVYYSYRIQGIQETWSEYSANPEILLYALPPGRYELQVRASANGSDKATADFELPILMTSYWYQKTWVWVMIFLALTALVAYWIRYWYQQRWKRQKALEALRIKISSDLHDDVGSILSGLAMQSQVMSYGMEEDRRKPMLELSDMSREAMERMRDTVWAIDARKDKYENLIDRMRDFAEKSLERKNMTHTFAMEGLDGKKFISPEVRQNIYLIFKEAITNIVRHSDGQHVVIRFAQEGHQMILSVYDNGTKREFNTGVGQGLSNMKMRAQKIGGSLEIALEGGFSVVLRVGQP